MSRVILLLAGLSLAFAPVPFRKADPAKADMRQLRGVWVFVAEPVPGGGLRPSRSQLTVNFEAGRATFLVEGRKATEWAVTVHPASTPRAMDLKQEGGGVLPAIYHVGDDTLTFSYSNIGAKRPPNFEPGPGLFPRVFQRKKG